MKAEAQEASLRLQFSIDGKEGMSRGLWVHPDGLWSIGVFRDAVQKEFQNKPIEAELSFDLDELRALAMLAMKSAPEARVPRVLAALGGSVLMLLESLGAIDIEDKEGPAA